MFRIRVILKLVDDSYGIFINFVHCDSDRKYVFGYIVIATELTQTPQSPLSKIHSSICFALFCSFSTIHHWPPAVSSFRET